MSRFLLSAHVVIPAETLERRDTTDDFEPIQISIYNDVVYISQEDETKDGLPPGKFDAIVCLTKTQAAQLYRTLARWFE